MTGVSTAVAACKPVLQGQMPLGRHSVPAVAALAVLGVFV
jgi:hypothetical protein